jgi:ribosomal protein S18 acetylase RimI-like enzyme
VTLAEVPRREVLGPVLTEIPAVWIGVGDDRLGEILPTHSSRKGFRFLAARVEGSLVGFTYGYLGAPGQWWHDIVSAAMTTEQRRRWLTPGQFELVELHVRPGFRRRGIGARLHDALLASVAGPTAVLSTQTDNMPALSLYRGRDWVGVVASLRFAPGGEKYTILGRDLSHGG